MTSIGDADGAISIFRGDPDLARDLIAVDWTATPLGAPATWPQSLQTAVDILLSSRFSMWMAWGPELTFFCNAAYRRDTLGRKYPWALGRPAAEVWAEIWDDIGPRIERVLATEQATWDSALLLFLERSGFSEETYHTFSYSPLRNDAAEVVGILCVVSEDTDRVISERRLATLRDLGSDPSVLPSEPDMLAFAARQLGRNRRDLPFTLTYLFDDHGAARLVARSGIPAGHPAAPATLAADAAGPWPVAELLQGRTVLTDLEGAPFTDLPSGEWAEPPRRAISVPLLLQGGAPCGFLVAGLNRYRPFDDGYRGFVELVAGQIAAEIGSARSYQAQQRRAEELAELDRAKTTFFSNISHEFRTPLTLILGPLDDLRSRAADPQLRAELDVLHRNGLRLSKLVNTLLDFSRIEAGRMQAHFEPVDVAAATVDLASIFRSAVERAGLELVVDCEPVDQPVYLDRDMWEKVILNLLSNAVKFTFEGAITVRVRREGQVAVVTVADTGVGVPAAEMPRLFERFHRIETARARSNEGSGIGLALVKELIGLHGGTITADSVQGVGTTFTIRLPVGARHLPADAVSRSEEKPAKPAGTADPFLQETLRWLPADEPAGPVAPVQPDVSAAGPGTPARVLVADDNADMRDYLSRLLSTAGYHVTVVGDGREALETVRAEVPDVVVSDVMMPGLDGLALVAALRSDPRTVAVPVLLLSARAGQEASIEGLESGADDYLIKPFAAAELLARVRANVEMARVRNHHARWRTALVESLQEAFFVCDQHGAVIEINAAFTDTLGYGPEGLPYEPVHPWWPTAAADPAAHRQVAEAFDLLLSNTQGSYTIPVTHRDGHRLWVTASFNHAHDPDTGRQVMVGTFRDVTAEHYAIQHQTALGALNQLLAQADSVDDALRAAAEEMVAMWRARQVLAVTFAGEDPDVVCAGEPAQWRDLPPDVRRRIEALRDADQLLPDTDRPGSAGIALQHPRGILVLHVELAEQRPFTAEDRTLLTVFAGRLGQGLHRVHQVDQQREAALALQHAILGPDHLPSGFTVRYQPASHPLQVGGDWYDVVELDGGRIGLVVGDCVGHNLAAATVMGQLRSACRALLLEHPSPRAALAALDRFAALVPGARCTTAFCAVLDPDTGELVYSCAGHPPPILVRPDRSIETLDGGRGIPLGIRTHTVRPEARVTMPARATLLMYTDGLVERRRESLDLGMARAADLVREGSAAPLDELAGEIMSRLAPDGGYQDDVALLLYRQPGPLVLTFPGQAQHLAETRNALRTWLTRAGVEADQAVNVLIAAGEAVANAIEHGHRDAPDGLITVNASALGNRVELTVTDTGCWKTPHADPKSNRGRGIQMMRALMNDVTIDQSADGTTVHMAARIA